MMLRLDLLLGRELGIEGTFYTSVGMVWGHELVRNITAVPSHMSLQLGGAIE